MKALHIIFNKEIPEKKKGKQFFCDTLLDVVKESYIELSHTEQLINLLPHLNKNSRCYLWLHAQLNAKTAYDDRISPGYVLEFERFFKTYNLKYTKISRNSQKSHNSDIIHTLSMNELSKCTSYSVKEMEELIHTKTSEKEEKKQNRRTRLIDDYKKDITDFNKDFKKYKSFLKKYNISSDKWWKQIILPHFSENKEKINHLFNHSYWVFDETVFNTYLNINDTNDILNRENLTILSSISYSPKNHFWEIDFDFFDNVSVRFENNRVNYEEKLRVAIRLFIIHETIHKHHNLDKNTVQGIGNFPRIVEYVDFQADAVAMILELFYMVSLKGELKDCPKDFIIKSILEIIEIAIETTFSFKPIETDLNRIQVRRVNRYSIWLWFYNNIELLFEENLDNKQSLLKILTLFSRKPIIEFSGLEILSQDNRTFFNLNSKEFDEELAFINSKNKIIRTGKSSDIDFNKLYDGFKSSEFDKLNEFYKSIVSKNKDVL